MRNRFCRQFDLNSSRLGRYDLLSVVQTEAVPMTQQQGGKSLGCFLKVISSQPHSPPAAPRISAVSVWRKEEIMLQWKFPVSLWGNTGSVLRRKHLGGSAKLRAEMFPGLTKRNENYLKRLKTESWLFFLIKVHLEPCVIKQCWGSMRELSGQYESFSNMALRQNQLWFPVTSLIQYVQHELKEGQENGQKSQQEESKILLVLQRLTLSLTLWQD